MIDKINVQQLVGMYIKRGELFLKMGLFYIKICSSFKKYNFLWDE